MKINFLYTVVVAFSISTNVLAASLGSSPKGQPFVSINNELVQVQGAISSLQDQIDMLVARVDTVEQRVGADETAIATLQDQNVALSALVQQNLSDVASIQDQIDTLMLTNVDLQAQISANSGDISTLQAQVDANQALLNTLNSAILMVQSSVISLSTSLQEQIDNNTILITALQQEVDSITSRLALKQNLINGICPDGSAVKQVLSDGSVVCQGVSGTTGQLETWYVIHATDLPPYYTKTLSNQCPSDFIVVSAGFNTYPNTEVLSSHTGLETFGGGFNGGIVEIKNLNNYRTYFINYTTCIRLVP